MRSQAFPARNKFTADCDNCDWHQDAIYDDVLAGWVRLHYRRVHKKELSEKESEARVKPLVQEEKK